MLFLKGKKKARLTKRQDRKKFISTCGYKRKSLYDIYDKIRYWAWSQRGTAKLQDLFVCINLTLFNRTTPDNSNQTQRACL